MNNTCVRKHNMFLLNRLFCTVIRKSVPKLCVVSQCIFLKIANARILHERGGASDRSNRPKAGSEGSS